MHLERCNINFKPIWDNPSPQRMDLKLMESKLSKTKLSSGTKVNNKVIQGIYFMVHNPKMFMNGDSCRVPVFLLVVHL